MSSVSPAAGAPDLRGTGSLRRDSGRNLAGSVVSQVALFSVIVLIARVEGQRVLGLYSVVFALRAILILVCGLGMRIALTKFVAASRARHDFGELRGSVMLGVTAPVLLGATLGTVLFAAAPWLSHEVFNSGDLVFPMRAAAASLPFAVMMDVSLAATQGFQSMRAHASIGLTLEPTLRLGLTATALALGWGLNGAAGALVLASVCGGSAALGTLLTKVRRLPHAHPVLPWTRLASFAAFSWVASMATQGILWADVVILGALVSSEDVGVYQVASRLVLAAMFVVTPLTTSMAPRIAHFWEHGDRDALTSRYLAVVLWAWRLSLPLIATMVVVPTAALHAFGADFSRGEAVILVLALGALVESMAAPSAVLLNQVGRNRLNMTVNLSALGANILLNLLLVPLLGILGAAIAWTLTLLVPGLVRVTAARRIATDRWPLGRPHAVAFGAAVAGAVVVEVVVAVLRPIPWWVELPGAGVLLVSIYVGVLVMFGLDDQEHAAVRRFLVMANRQAGIRLPALRRWKNRWRVRAQSRGRDPLDIDALISPHRFDILARVSLFDCARQHADLLERDFDAFIEKAQQSLYRVWFDAVLVRSLHLTNAPAATQERAFRQNVMRSIYLMRSYDKVGFDTRHPITVAVQPAGEALNGRALAEDRWLPVDGCHRLALLISSGQEQLLPDQYVIDPHGERLNNTEAMVRALGMPNEDLLAFLARGLVAREQRDVVRTWEDLLDQLAEPANRELLSGWPEAARFVGAPS